MQTIVALDRVVFKRSTWCGRYPTKYEYNVETDNAGNIIYLKRPTNLNKGFDFEVRVSNMRFKHINKNGRISYSNRPSHDNIIDDLAEKKAEDSSQFTLLLTVIDAIFNCVEIDPQIYCKFSFRSGYPVDMICKCIKWLFIEQDIPTGIGVVEICYTME